jgi:predicted Zn-ribbon and HTH transcriptional regulator
MYGEMNTELDPNTRERVLREHARRKSITFIILILAWLAFIIGLFSVLYGETFTNLTEDTEMALFLSIAGAILVFTVIYWRCANCGHLFLWKLQPKKCDKCGVNLVKIKEEVVDPNDWRYYIRLRKKNTLKYYLYLSIIFVVNIGLILLLITAMEDATKPTLFVILAFTFFIPWFIIDRNFLRCPKCEYRFGRRIPEKCPHCKAILKDPNSGFWR